jgi:uncharacterized protein (DUF486 family)
VLRRIGKDFGNQCFQVPANRMGLVSFTTAQLKLVVFSIFSVT